MSSNGSFRVGFTPDLVGDMHAAADHAIEQIFSSLPNLEHDILPDTGGTATAKVVNQYDAIICLAYYFPPSAFAGVTRTACVARWGVGFDRVDVPACTRLGTNR